MMRRLRRGDASGYIQNSIVNGENINPKTLLVGTTATIDDTFVSSGNEMDEPPNFAWTVEMSTFPAVDMVDPYVLESVKSSQCISNDTVDVNGVANVFERFDHPGSRPLNGAVTPLCVSVNAFDEMPTTRSSVPC
jgi:hypothetical protein